MELETILTFLLVILTAVFIVVGVYLVIILIDIHQSIKHINKVVGHLDSITRIIDEKVVRPASSIASLAKVFGDLVDVLKEFSNKKRGKANE